MECNIARDYISSTAQNEENGQACSSASPAPVQLGRLDVNANLELAEIQDSQQAINPG